MPFYNKTKQKLEAGDAVIGVRMDYASADIVEIMGQVGYDFLYYDCEHAPMNEETNAEMIRVAELVGITPMVRVYENTPACILRALDSGAMGVIIPHCNTKEEAEAAVRAAKYPPMGERGIAGRSIRMSGMAPADYVEAANRETMIVAMVEEERAIENLDEILEVDGIDVIWVGRGDLSLSMGLPGQYTHTKVEAAISTAIEKARAAGKIIGVGAMPPNDPETVVRFTKQGAQFFSITNLNLFKIAAKDWLDKAKGIK